MNGKLFDVVKKEYTENGIVFYCIDDSQEAQLFKNLDALTDKQMEKKNLNLKDKLLLCFYQLQDQDFKLVSKEDLQHSFYLQKSFSASPPADSPPPEV